VINLQKGVCQGKWHYKAMVRGGMAKQAVKGMLKISILLVASESSD